MRAEWSMLVDGYPRFPGWRDPGFKGSPVIKLLNTGLPTSIKRALPQVPGRYEVVGSAGQSTWTHTPWVALLDPAVTTSVEEGFYVVYLLSLGAQRGVPL
jgi:MrcB-like, N-terminal domain